MRYSDEVKNYILDLVDYYVKFDRKAGEYKISIMDIADYSLHELAGMLLAEDASLTNEATGPDNPLFLNKMLPALHLHLKNTTDQDLEIEFTKAWREGICIYTYPIINELLQAEVLAKNQDEGFTYKDVEPGLSREKFNNKSMWY